jgi:peptide deformylase
VLINPVITPVLTATDSEKTSKSATAGVFINKFAIENIAFDLRYTANPADMQEDWEGCLSVPGLRGIVPRFERIRYQGFDETGQSIDRTAEGFHARVVQHECDHLFGILYPMRVKDFKRFGFTSVLFPGLDASQDDD